LILIAILSKQLAIDVIHYGILALIALVIFARLIGWLLALDQWAGERFFPREPRS
jgi:hypothetical protein